MSVLVLLLGFPRNPSAGIRAGQLRIEPQRLGQVGDGPVRLAGLDERETAAQERRRRRRLELQRHGEVGDRTVICSQAAAQARPRSSYAQAYFGSSAMAAVKSAIAPLYSLSRDQARPRLWRMAGSFGDCFSASLKSSTARAHSYLCSQRLPRLK